MSEISRNKMDRLQAATTRLGDASEGRWAGNLPIDVITAVNTTIELLDEVTSWGSPYTCPFDLVPLVRRTAQQAVDTLAFLWSRPEHAPVIGNRRFELSLALTGAIAAAVDILHTEAR